MDYNTCTLANGLRVIHLPSRSPVLYCGYEIAAGTRHERPGEEGLAHFCEHVTFKGTERRRSWHILNCMERVGGDLNAFTNKEDTVFYTAVLHEHANRAIDLLTDIVFHSVYPQSEIDKEVEIICDEIESYHDTPAELIYDEFENLIFSGHSLGHNILGTASRVRSFTQADALRFTHAYYRPDNAVFFAYGDIDFHRLVRMLCRATEPSPLAPHDEVQAAATTLPKPMKPAIFEDTKGQTIVSERHTHQAHVMVGTRAYAFGDSRRMPLYLLNNLLGGPGMNARLNLSLRERNGLVYTVESMMTCYGDTGLWATYFGCDPADVDRCLRLVRRELDKLMAKPLSATQLAAAKRQLKGQISVACDNRESFALSFGKSFLHYGQERNIPALYAAIDRITPDDLWQVARHLFAPDRLYTLIYK
ncbi:MAG: pitrilysin family protein [Bacteroidales bacterium]|nr:pitrilysin family protein [Bacteroidales bacterium]